jgi:hypothetical protein
MKHKVIKTADEHHPALQRLGVILDAEPGTADGDEPKR